MAEIDNIKLENEILKETIEEYDKEFERRKKVREENKKLEKIRLRKMKWAAVTATVLAGAITLTSCHFSRVKPTPDPETSKQETTEEETAEVITRPTEPIQPMQVFINICAKNNDTPKSIGNALDEYMGDNKDQVNQIRLNQELFAGKSYTQTIILNEQDNSNYKKLQQVISSYDDVMNYTVQSNTCGLYIRETLNVINNEALNEGVRNTISDNDEFKPGDVIQINPQIRKELVNCLKTPVTTDELLSGEWTKIIAKEMKQEISACNDQLLRKNIDLIEEEITVFDYLFNYGLKDEEIRDNWQTLLEENDCNAQLQPGTILVINEELSKIIREHQNDYNIENNRIR